MPWLPKQRVIVPIDFSEVAFEAIDVANDLVADPASVHLIHVLHEISPLEVADAERLVAEEQVSIAKAKAALRSRLEPRYAAMQVEAVVGNPGHAIAAYAQAIDADLIVMPSHGRTGLARMLIGSVAERVIRLAHCPVLVLRR